MADAISSLLSDTRLLNNTPIATWNTEVKYIDLSLLNPENLICIPSSPIVSDLMEAEDETKSRFRIMIKHLPVTNTVGMYILTVMIMYFTFPMLSTN